MSKVLTKQPVRLADSASIRRAATRGDRSPPIGNQALLRRLQAKLTVGAVNDPREQEADAAADQVMRMADAPSPLSAAPLLRRTCADCEDAAQPLQREAAGSVMAGETAPPIVHTVLGSPGRPLDNATRTFMEPRFCLSFADVVVQTDSVAQESARLLHALAYTFGNHLVFSEGRFSPGTPGGDRLLAHELAHVAQQTGPLSPQVAKRESNRPDSLLANNFSARLPPDQLARAKEDDATRRDAGSQTGYVAIYLAQGDLSGARIDFHSDKGLFRYHLSRVGALKAGEYFASVSVENNNVKFALDAPGANLFDFDYVVAAGQPNPATLLAHQTHVTFSIVDDLAPEFVGHSGQDE